MSKQLDRCPTCFGTGRGTFGGPCGMCSGRGTVGYAGMYGALFALMLVLVVVIAVAL